MSTFFLLLDPYSTGCLIAHEIQRRGYHIAALWTDGFAEAMKTHVPMSCGELHWYGQLDELKTLEETANAVQKLAGDMDIIGCIAGLGVPVGRWTCAGRA